MSQWFEERFQEREDRLRFDCIGCGRGMWFPKSKLGKYKTCGSVCNELVRSQVKACRQRNCHTCGTKFFPRTTQIDAGEGKYCSVHCGLHNLALGRTSAAAAKRGIRRKQMFASGLWKPLYGPSNPRWKGGRAAYLARQALNSVDRSAKRRAYLRANPEKAREWRQKRRGLGRLPRGTVRRIGEAQKWRCAACQVGIRHGYHVDHIMPLALGGIHEPLNLQLLCGPCNLSKSAKHPIRFMQEKGFLL